MADIRIQAGELGDAIQQVLTLYHQNVVEGLDAASDKAVKDLVKKTKATAPKGRRGSYRKRIAGKLLKESRNGSTYVWYVKAPDYRLTHLLVKGHATRNGKRTRADPFLQNALSQVLPDYEAKVKEVLQNGK